MPIDRLSSSTSDAIFQDLLSSQDLATSTKNKLAGSAHGSQDVFDAANRVLAGDGESLDSFDIDHDGQLSADERDAAVSALVRLLSNPDLVQAFLAALNGPSSTDDAKVGAITAPTSASSPSQPTGAGGSTASQGQQPAGSAAGSTASQGQQPAGSAAGVGGSKSGAVPQGGLSQASEFGSEKNVDPKKNFDTVPGGGYSVADATADIEKLAANDKKETGPKPSPAQAKELAQGIINGVNNYFDKSTNPKETAQALIASAWKESKYNFNSPNGGVFQTAKNRFEDYQKAHPGSTLTFDQLSTTGNPAAAIDVSLWAIAHPAPGLGQPSGVSTPVPPDGSPTKALYFWNYNNRPLGGGGTELDEYIARTNYFRSLLS